MMYAQSTGDVSISQHFSGHSWVVAYQRASRPSRPPGFISPRCFVDMTTRERKKQSSPFTYSLCPSALAYCAENRADFGDTEKMGRRRAKLGTVKMATNQHKTHLNLEDPGQVQMAVRVPRQAEQTTEAGQSSHRESRDSAERRKKRGNEF
jgi:hypothetical protein